MKLKNKIKKEIIKFTGGVEEVHANGLLKRIMLLIENDNKKQISLDTAKQIVAKKFRKDWKAIEHDFDYGLGVSKMVSFQELMDMVSEVYKNGK